MADNKTPKSNNSNPSEEKREYSEEERRLASRLHAQRCREVWEGHKEVVIHTMLIGFGVIDPTSEEDFEE